MMRHIVLITALLASVHCTAQESIYSTAPDHVLASAGEHRVGLSTGIPFVAMAEYSVGVTEGFSVGAMFGTTPFVKAYGVRLRGLLFENDQRTFRVMMRGPVLFYPSKGASMPWWLAFPQAMAEWKLPTDVRLSVQAGALGTICAVHLQNTLFGANPAAVEDTHDGHDHSHELEPTTTTSVPTKVWGAIGFGSAVPVADRLTITTDVNVVMDGLDFAGDDWVGGPPVVMSFGVVFAL